MLTVGPERMVGASPGLRRNRPFSNRPAAWIEEIEPFRSIAKVMAELLVL